MVDSQRVRHPALPPFCRPLAHHTLLLVLAFFVSTHLQWSSFLPAPHMPSFAQLVPPAAPPGLPAGPPSPPSLPALPDLSQLLLRSSTARAYGFSSISAAAVSVPATTDDRSAWVGTFDPVPNQCTPSPTCCCGTSPMSVTLDASNPLGLIGTGNSDGGAGCFMQATLGGPFVLTTRYAGYSQIAQIALVINMTLSEDTSQLTITSTRTTCPVQFHRDVMINGPSSSSSSSSSTGAVGPVPTGGAYNATSFGHRVTLLNAASSSSSSASSASSSLSHDYLVAFAVPSTTPVQSVHVYFTTSATLPIRSALMSLQYVGSATTSAMHALTFPELGTLSSPPLLYAYAPLSLADTDAVTLWFEYALPGDVLVSTPTFSYSYAVVLAKDRSDPIDYDEDAAPATSLLTGSYQVIDGCRSTATCCCGTGIINVIQHALPRQLVITGVLDGSSACFRQSSIGGVFVQNASNALQAGNDFSANGATLRVKASLSSTLSESSGDAADSGAEGREDALLTPAYVANLPLSQVASLQSKYAMLTLTNSLFTCPTRAVRVSGISALLMSMEGGVDGAGGGAGDSAADAGDALVNSAVELARWKGTYQFDATCPASVDCCCAVGTARISNLSVYANPTTVTTAAAPALPLEQQSVVWSSALSGGVACVGQTWLEQSMRRLVSTTDVSSGAVVTDTRRLFVGDTAYAVRVTNAIAPTLTVSSEVNPSCVSVAQLKSRTVAWTSTQGPPPSGGGDAASSSGSDDLYQAWIKNVEGDYESDGMCVPSERCCCSTGLTRVVANNGSAHTLQVATTLEGVMLSCFNMDGPLDLTFNVINATYAVCTELQLVTFAARFDPSSQSVLIENTLQPACPTRLTRKDASSDAATRASSALFAAAVAVFVSMAATLVAPW